jgi:hypothetical protein
MPSAESERNPMKGNARRGDSTVNKSIERKFDLNCTNDLLKVGARNV